jgi:hypothetical protein
VAEEKETPDTEPEDDKQDAPESEDHEGSTDARLTGLENAVNHIRKLVEGKGGVTLRKPAGRSGDPEAVAAQVKDEVEKLRQADEAKRRSASTSARLKEMEDKIKRLTEKAPVELRAVTRYLWGDPEDEGK